jgi:hypothetical protein
MTVAATSRTVIRAQGGPQKLLLTCPAEEVFYGGARGGGKSYGGLLDFNQHAMTYGAHAKGILFRQTYPELEDLMAKADEIYPQVGAKWLAARKVWRFPDGAWLKMRYLEKERDALKYQGHEYTWVGIDEAGNYATAGAIDTLRATLRSAHGVKKRLYLSGNPGGVGHNWLKERYVLPAPPCHIVSETSEITGQKWRRVFIPAKVQDNELLMANDPGYIDQIVKATTGKPWLMAAWLEGSWDIVAGGIVDDLWSQDMHVIRPFSIPRTWRLDRSFDYGSSKPFSVGWWAESDGTTAQLSSGEQRTFPRGTLFRIAEWYGWNGKANEGCRMLAKDIARGIKEREQAMGLYGRVRPGPADSSVYDVVNGTCIADDMAMIGIQWTRADKGPGSRKAGWEALRQRLSDTVNSPVDEAGLYIFETCRHFIRTVPVLPRDERDPDDVDTDAEDHIGDETRYRLRAKKRDVGLMRTTGI